MSEKLSTDKTKGMLLADVIKQGGPLLFGRHLLISKPDRMRGTTARGPYDLVTFKHTVAIGDPSTGEESFELVEMFDAPPNTPEGATFRSAFALAPGLCAFLVTAAMKGKTEKKLVYRLKGIFPVSVSA